MRGSCLDAKARGVGVAAVLGWAGLRATGLTAASVLLPPPQDWQVQYQQVDSPVAPRFDVNAPDLYIPGTSLCSLSVTGLSPRPPPHVERKQHLSFAIFLPGDMQRERE